VVLSTKYGRQSTEEYTHDGRLIGRSACNQEPDGNRDIRHKIYIGSGHQRDVKPYVLWVYRVIPSQLVPEHLVSDEQCRLQLVQAVQHASELLNTKSELLNTKSELFEADVRAVQQVAESGLARG
jgi:hypothetical protein